jgi:FKBP-type peptidyl-prolyl cis-trans isomerase SlyD
MSTIATGKVVSIHYTLKDDDGQVLDASEENEPLLYLHGAENIVPGLERQLEGAAVGETRTAVVPPAEGYGERSDDEVQLVPRAEFPDDMPLEPGIGFAVEGPEGQTIPLWILEVRDQEVVVDANHPLAGKTLHFEVTVAAVRDATADETAHGHPHGPTGHEGHGHHH